MIKLEKQNNQVENLENCKECSRCKKIKTIYHKGKCLCGNCKRLVAIEKNPELLVRQKARQKKYYENNKEVTIKYFKKYYQEHKEELNSKQKIYNEKNKIKNKIVRDKYYKENKMEIRAKRREKYWGDKNNKEKIENENKE